MTRRDEHDGTGPGGGRPASRLDRQLALMGLQEGVPEAELVAERRAMDAAKPLPLTFPTARADAARPLRAVAEEPKQRFAWPRIGWSAGGMLLAAGLALVVLRKEPDAGPEVRVKGAGHVQVFYEQDGQVSPLKEGAVLREGARVKAEVQAAGPARAFWGVASRDGRLLTDAAWIWQAKLDLGEGEKRYFSGSLALEGASEGETLGVVLCPEGAVKEPMVEQVAAAVAGKPLPPELAACRVQRFPLRP
jgi:hypothetical protein